MYTFLVEVAYGGTDWCGRAEPIDPAIFLLIGSVDDIVINVGSLVIDVGIKLQW
jgi:hypothetical protein